MANSIKDFEVGDKVSHLSNSKIAMVVISLEEQANTISCRWIDNDGQTQCVEFIPQELEKYKKLSLKSGIA